MGFAEVSNRNRLNREVSSLTLSSPSADSFADTLRGGIATEPFGSAALLSPLGVEMAKLPKRGVVAIADDNVIAKLDLEQQTGTHQIAG